MYLTDNQKTVLQILGNDEMTVEALLEKCLKKDKTQRTYHWKKVLERMDEKLIVITQDATVYAMERAKGYVDTPKPKKERVERFIPTGKYDGAELGRTCHRPGAYDFMEIPSLREGERIYPRRTVGLTTGINKTWLGK